ncbi:unnamed protein product [Lymnaea stagnalis]|uniref:SAM-dependent MTase RsmB/NOP-type domain-containing protein n=1 Tax=Lymnaea stagnalis TaxID=6523 RepID=A0AAV2GZH2_LYMST
MSPTADSSVYKQDSPMPYHFPPIRNNASATSTDSTSIARRHGEESDAPYKGYAPGIPLQKGLAPRASRDSFPPSASVSLPTSTTPIDYLLHVHTLRSDTVDGREFPERSARLISKRDRVRSEGTLGFSGGRWSDPAMTKTLSASDAETYERRRSSSSKENSSISRQFFHKEPCLYTHRMFHMASKIFAVLKKSDQATEELNSMRKRKGLTVVEHDTIPDMEFSDLQEQVKTFELTFAALKFQELLQDILDKTGFFSENSQLRDDYSLVCIILYDLQSRKFQRRTAFPDEVLDDVCLEVEDALLNVKTRILSVIAKERIKNNAPSIEYLLPESIRNKDETKSLTPVYMWVNQFKATLEEVIVQLNAEEFTALEPGLDISEQTTKVFKVDEQCSDLLVFPPHMQLEMKDSQFVKNGLLVLQDKSSCLAPQSVFYLLGLDQDVIHVNVGTGLTTAHLASLLRKKSPNSHVWGYGNQAPDRIKKVYKNLEFLGVKNSKILSENFVDVDPDDFRLKNVKVILITANCSKSAITSPVQFIVSEGEDMKVLGELSKSDNNMTYIGELMAEHEKLLKHALKFPKVQAIVYTTRSRHEAENESVVTKVLEFVNATSNNKKVPFTVTPPVLPFSGDEIDSEVSGVDGRYIRYLPSSKSNGCFVAIISREPQDPKEVARMAIARAKSKGMLGKNSHAAEANGEGEGVAKDEVSRHVSRKLRGGSSSPEHHGLKTKVTSHKSAAAIGARLYQAGLLSKMKQAKLKPHKPEHVKVVKHPAPFSSNIDEHSDSGSVVWYEEPTTSIKHGVSNMI